MKYGDTHCEIKALNEERKSAEWSTERERERG